MKDLNNVVLIGRLAKDIDMKELTENTCLLSGCIVSNTTKNENGKFEDKANFFNFINFKKSFDISSINSFVGLLKKGTKIVLQGELVQDKWQDKNGYNRNDVKILAKMINIIDSKNIKNIKTNEVTQEGLLEDQIYKTFKDKDIPF